MKRSILLFSTLSFLCSRVVAQNFTPVTGAVITNSFTSWGISWVDYDSDGDLDLYVNDKDQHRLYRNEGSGVFTNSTPAGLASPAPLGFYYTTAWGDYNNDGFPDAYLGNDGDKNALFKGGAGGVFTQVTTGPQVTDMFHTFANVSWVDFNNDGFLDLFCSNVQNTQGVNEKNNLYQNYGGTSFTKVTTGNIVNDLADNWCHAWADFNNDRCPDLFVGNMGNDFFYKNNCDATFTKITTGPEVSDGQDTESASWGDYDNDGDLDLFAGIWGNPCRLYRNNGDETFTKVTGSPLDNNTDQVTGSGWGDYDNDGFLDLYVCCWVSTGGTHNRLYHNNGNGTFTEITGSALTSATVASNACLWADIDNDGDLDLYVANKSASNELLRNNGDGHSFITVRCTGSSSNRSAIGAKVRIRASLEDGITNWQMREIGGVSGQLTQNPLCAYFGLRSATVIDSMIVEWPSGQTCYFTNVSPNQNLVVQEENCSVAALAVTKPAAFGSSTATSYPNPFSAATTISYSLLEQSDVSLQITDASGRVFISVLNRSQLPGKYETVVTNAQLPAAGTYFYSIRAGRQLLSGKLVFTGK